MKYLFQTSLIFILLTLSCFAEKEINDLANRVSELERRMTLLSYGLSKLSNAKIEQGENIIESPSNFINNNESESFPTDPLDDLYDGEDLNTLSDPNNFESSSLDTLDDPYGGEYTKSQGLLSPRSSKNGLIGSDYVGIGFLHAWNKDYDATHQEFFIQARRPFWDFLDLKAGVDLAVSDTEGGPENDYYDHWGNTIYLPKHNRWSLGASLGLDLHHEFSVSDNFSIDPFVGVSLPLDYYFTTEYDVMSYIRYGYSFSLGAELNIFDSFSILPSYKISKFSYLQEDGESSTDDGTRNSFNLSFNYFFSNSFLNLAYIHELDTQWRAFSFSYNLGY